MKYFAGIEGGATGSRCVLFQVDDNDCRYSEIANSEGGSTNRYAVGIDKATEQIGDMLQNCIKSSDNMIRISSLGLALAGAEGDASDQEIPQMLIRKYPHMLDKIDITSDAIGSIRATGSAGAVLIAGTGSTLRLLDDDGSVHKVGGHAHLVGDEGSATFIALQAVRAVFGQSDGLRPCQDNVAYIKEQMYDYFQISELQGMYEHLYNKFDKAFFARFALRVVSGAERNDTLCMNLMHENGSWLGRHVSTAAREASQILLSTGLRVVCVGSVFNSWKFMRQGFIEGCRFYSNPQLKKVILLKMNDTPAKGMAIYTAHKFGILTDPIDLSIYTTQFDIIDL